VNNNLNISTGNAYQINGVSVLNATTLGSGVTASSLTSVGTLASLAVTGDLTVDTSTLKVDAANNRVGIGTASPGASLEVNNGINNTNGTVTIRTVSGLEGGNAVGFFGTVGAHALLFRTNSIERARIDASGNVGIGVTPSASNLAGIIEGGYGTFGQTTSLGTSIAGNAYYNSGWKYKGTGIATLQLQDSNGVSWSTAPSGTAGNAISFTQAMTLDASGQLGVGATSPGAKFEVANNGSGMGTIARIRRNNSTDQHFLDIGVDPDANLVKYQSTGSSAGGHTFFSGNDERIRFSIGGGLWLGADNSFGMAANHIQFQGGASTGRKINLYQEATVHMGMGVDLGGGPYEMSIFYPTGDSDNGSLRFGTVSLANPGTWTEAARFTGKRYFKASNDGTYLSSTGLYHELQASENGTRALAIRHQSATDPYGVDLRFDAASPDNNTNYFLRCNDSTTDRLIIYSDGDVLNHDGVYGTISDEKLKQDITDAGSSWDDLKNIRFRKYRFISDVEQKGEDAPYLLGVIAQELEQTSPGLVDEHPDMESVEVEVEVEKTRPVMHEVEEVVTDAEGVESLVTKSVPTLDEDGQPVTETYTEVETRTEQRPTGTFTKSVKQSILLMKAAVTLQEAMARIESLEARLDALEN
jgi:hypothetical protein